jgi:hypothetical protein
VTVFLNITQNTSIINKKADGTCASSHDVFTGTTTDNYKTVPSI